MGRPDGLNRALDMSLSIVECGVGNIGSVVHACRRAGINATIARTGEELERQQPERILLPGVGAIGEVLSQLRSRDFEPALNRLVIERRTPLLGICVGMQILAERCVEFGEHAGLGWLPGASTHRLAEKGSGLRLPHMGWNTIEPALEHPLLTGLKDQHFYFVHSYVVDCGPEARLAQTEYGSTFVCAVHRDNILGVQFHPEKSGAAGVRLLQNFMGADAC